MVCASAVASTASRSSSRRGCHSLCQSPGGRSSSASCAPSSVEARPGARRAAATSSTAGTGLRFCGMAEEPPSPSGRSIESSPSSSREPCAVSRPMRPRAPSSDGEGGAEGCDRRCARRARRWGGRRARAGGRSRPARPRHARGRAGRRAPRACRRSRRAAPAARVASRAARRAEHAVEQHREAQAGGRRRGLLREGAGDGGGVPVRVGELGEPLDDERQALPDPLPSAVGDEHEGGVEHVLAGGAGVQHVAELGGGAARAAPRAAGSRGCRCRARRPRSRRRRGCRRPAAPR